MAPPQSHLSSPTNATMGELDWRLESASPSNIRKALCAEILLTQKQIGRVIGKGGVSIRRIQAECGAYFFVNKDRTAPNGDAPFEIYAASAEQLEMAKRLVMEKVVRLDFYAKLRGHQPAATVKEPAKKLPSGAAHLDTLFENMQGAFTTVLRDMVAEEMKSALVESYLPNVPLCKGCSMRKSEVLFNCGHLTHCYGCSLQCIECPSCRMKLTEKTRLFHFPK